MFSVPQVCKRWASKPWLRPCQGETVKVKFVYNRLTGENGGGRSNQIKSRTTSKEDAPRLDIRTTFLQPCFLSSVSNGS